MAIKTYEVYDSFHPDRLLDIRFEISDAPCVEKSFRSSYASLWELIDGCIGKHTKRVEFPRPTHEVIGHYFLGFEQ